MLVNPRVTPYMLSERYRLGQLERQWVPLTSLPAVTARSAAAAEDANFCRHHGFDLAAIRKVLSSGKTRGASTISQQVVKNVYLWQGRSWLRKGLEALLTPAVDLLWSKHRIMEVYLNVAEFDTGVFGVAAGARRYFGIEAGELNARQAALLAAVLPDPKRRSASEPTEFLNQQADRIMKGAATIKVDGRDRCFTTR